MTQTHAAARASQVTDGPIESLTRLVADGKHNAFTDMVRFNGLIYLTYRASSGHGAGDGSIVLLTSPDGGQWTAAPSPFAAGRNYYEGHMLVHAGRLYMFGGSYESGPKLNKLTQQQMVSWTDDGKTWTAPRPTYLPRWRFWRPVSHGGKIVTPAYTVDYGMGRPDGSFPDEAWRVDLLVSDDGVNWERRGAISDRQGCNETQLIADGSGTLHAFCRRETQPGGMLHYTGSADLTRWSGPRDRGIIVQGQNIARLDGRVFMIGRHRPGSDRYSTVFERRDTIRTRVWVMEKGFWIDYAELPSGADCSYAGILPIGPGRALVSYYSQHEYVAQSGFEDMSGASDIFLARLRTDLPGEWGSITPYGQNMLAQRASDGF